MSPSSKMPLLPGCRRSATRRYCEPHLEVRGVLDTGTVCGEPDPNSTLRVTPAMEAGVADHLWSLEEIARLAD